MRVIARKVIVAFEQKHPDSITSLETWFRLAKEKKWARPTDITDDIATASIIPNNRVVFNIKGNTYRMVVAVEYKRYAIFIKFIGTHSEYDKIDATTIEYKE